jgi:hypothetical protein
VKISPFVLVALTRKLFANFGTLSDMKRRLVLVLLFLLTACTPASAQPTVSGLARAKDGDSLMVGSTEVRLFSYADFVPA